MVVTPSDVVADFTTLSLSRAHQRFADNAKSHHILNDLYLMSVFVMLANQGDP